MFHQLIFPVKKNTADRHEDLKLRTVQQHRLSPQSRFTDSSYVIFDFETTGLSRDRDEIIEIGALKVEANKPVQEFSCLIKPSKSISPRITEITGITNQDLETAPHISEVFSDFIKFIDGSILIAHNAEFDIGFLRAACSNMGLSLIHI